MDQEAVKQTANPKKAEGKLAYAAYLNQTRMYFESIIQTPILYIEVQKVAEPYLYLDLRNLIVLLIYETFQLNRWVQLCVVSKQFSDFPVTFKNSKSTLLRLKSSIIFHKSTIIVNESITETNECKIKSQDCLSDIFENVQKRTHPSITVKDKKLIICGLSSVLRFVFKYTCFRLKEQQQNNVNEDEAILFGRLQQYLGFRGGCLQACAESSIWTKFCEVDLITAVNEISNILESVNLSNNESVECNLETPKALMRFEHHLSLPVKIHNFRKVVQDLRKIKLNEKPDTVSEELCNEKITDLNHEFAEGPTLLLSDLILFPSVHACIELLNRSSFESLLPLTLKWYDNVQKNLSNLQGLDVNCCLVRGENNLKFKWKVPEVKVESLYSRGYKSYKPALQQFTRQYEIDEALEFLKSCDVRPLGIIEEDPCFKWADIPLLAHPEGGSLPVSRQSRKCEQLASMAYYALKVYSTKTEQCSYDKQRRPFRIVDFCSGGGHLGILVAWLLPQSEVILVENKDESLRRAQERVKGLGLSNVYFYQSNLDYFENSFDLGMALHACGTATDLVLEKSVKANASFVCCPCCYGSMQENHILNYPRSVSFNNIKIPLRYYFILCHSSDQTHEEAHEKTNQGKQCMAFVDTDRCLYALDNGYEVKLCKIVPETASPKNHILVGISSVKK